MFTNLVYLYSGGVFPRVCSIYCFVRRVNLVQLTWWLLTFSDGLFAHGVVVSSVLYIAGPAGAWKYSGTTWTDITGGMQVRTTAAQHKKKQNTKKKTSKITTQQQQKKETNKQKKKTNKITTQQQQQQQQQKKQTKKQKKNNIKNKPN